MAMYPIQVTGEDLYTSSNTRQHELGTVGTFNTDKGPVMAMYVRNNNSASLAAGLAVGVGASGLGHVDTAAVAAAGVARNIVLGGLAASLASSAAGGYGWVIMQGPQTNAFFGATLASSAAARAMVVSSNAALTTNVSTVSPATNSNVFLPVALLRPNAAIGTTGTAAAAAAGAVVDWLWR